MNASQAVTTSGAVELPIVQLDDVVRSYGPPEQRVRALGPLSLSVFAGEFIALMGPSGSGKSTLLSLAGALDQPTHGRVTVAGHDLGGVQATELASLRRQTIGFVFQDLNLLPGLTALENIALPLELDGQKLSGARQAAAERLHQVGLPHLADRFPEELSGGERQRVAIARAFVGPRQLLLADEPTGALDSLTGESVMKLLREHADAGKTVILVTHNAAHAAWADRVLTLRDGQLVQPNSQPARSPS